MQELAEREMWEAIVSQGTGRVDGPCATCGHTARVPYERRVDGKLTEACMDKCHGAFLDCRSADYLSMWDRFHTAA